MLGGVDIDVHEWGGGVTARYDQHSSVERHSPLGKTLELILREGVGSRSGTALSPPIRKQRLSLLSRSQP
jgi:hypothetical protein